MRNILQRFKLCKLNGVKVVNKSAMFTTIDVKLNIPHRRSQRVAVKVNMEIEECRNWWNPHAFYRVNVNTTLNNTSKKILARYPSLRTFRSFDIQEQHVLGQRMNEHEIHVLADKMAARFVSHLERLMFNKAALPYGDGTGRIDGCTAAGELPVLKRTVEAVVQAA